MNNIIQSDLIGKEQKFIWEIPKENAILNVTDFLIQGNQGSRFYINDSLYPVIILDSNNSWYKNFKGEIDFYKIKITPVNDYDNFIVTIKYR